MSSATPPDVSPVVCLDAEVVTMGCSECGAPYIQNSPRHRFCSATCRQRAHRAPQRKRRNDWNYLKHRDSHYTLGALSVQAPSWLGPLSQFGKK